MELLNEGGLLAFITSRGIADTPGNKFVREYLVNHADLISAIRLPDMLFMQTSGIEVGSDLLIFQSTRTRRYSHNGNNCFTSRQGKGGRHRHNDRIRQQIVYHAENYPCNR